MTQQAENELEELLHLAAGEPAYRPQFYKTLLDSQIWFLGNTDRTDGSSETIVEAGDQVRIEQWSKPDGTVGVPFFTSLTALQQATAKEEDYAAMSTRQLFKMTEGATLVLNPGSEFGSKEFNPTEIAQLLARGAAPDPDTHTLDADTKVLLSQPSPYPSQLADSLSTLFAQHPEVKRAYLALMAYSESPDQAQLLIGVETDGDINEVAREMTVVAEGQLPEGQAADLCHVDPESGGLSQQFIQEVTPFYEREERKSSRTLKSWFRKRRNA